MGARGVSGLTKYIIGSNTASLMEISHIPVLAIPEEAEFKSLKNVVFASNLRHMEEEIKTLLPYLKVFDATLHVVHITSKAKETEKLQEGVKEILKEQGYRKSTVTIKVSKDIDESIADFVQQLNADMLAMFTHEHSFFDKLFNRSVTKKMAFQSKVPLLAFKWK
jgi:nucleotide-binding universal stress UspA family protein